MVFCTIAQKTRNQLASISAHLYSPCAYKEGDQWVPRVGPQPYERITSAVFKSFTGHQACTMAAMRQVEKPPVQENDLTTSKLSRALGG
jgi:hypothetical protein